MTNLNPKQQKGREDVFYEAVEVMTTHQSFDNIIDESMLEENQDTFTDVYKDNDYSLDDLLNDVAPSVRDYSEHYMSHIEANSASSSDFDDFSDLLD